MKRATLTEGKPKVVAVSPPLGTPGIILIVYPDIVIVDMHQSESLVAQENRVERNLTITYFFRQPRHEIHGGLAVR
jgi:hypothetical protein